MGKQADYTKYVAVAIFIGVALYGLSLFGVFGGSTVAPDKGSGQQVGNVVIPLSTAQTISVTVLDAMKGQTAVATPSMTLYRGAASGTDFSALTKIGVSTSTSPGNTYTVISEKTGFFSTFGTFTTDNQATDYLTLKQEAADTAISLSILNPDGLTTNRGANAAGSPQALAASTSQTFYLRLTPSAQYKVMAGPLDKFTVTLNSTNSTAWDTSGMSLTGFNNVPCVVSTQPTPTTIGGTVIQKWDCTGDFDGINVGFRQMPITLKANSNPPGASNASVCFAGWDIYNNTITNVPAYGAFKDNGAATLQTAQCVKLETT